MTRHRTITWQGRTRTLGQWSHELGCPKTTITGRIERFGLDEAMCMPPAPPRAPRRPVADVEAEKARRIIRMREKAEGVLLDDVAAELGVSRERARQVEEAALEKMRIGMELAELIGAELAVELLSELRVFGISEWRVTLKRFQRVAREAARMAA